MLTNGPAIEHESACNVANAKICLCLKEPQIMELIELQKPSFLRTAIVYGCNSMQPVFAELRLVNSRSRSRAPEAFDLDQYLEDEYSYLTYPKYARTHKDPVEEIMIFHSGSQVLSYDFGHLNPVNKLISAVVVDDFPEVLKWHGNLIVLSVVKGKVKNFSECEEELRRVDIVVHNYIRHFLGKCYVRLLEFHGRRSLQDTVEQT
ncbi:hypothetical protein ARMSODRAFT_1016915 [Armillaria solidipes]|uniref:Uncharacterized protein n=1 Tax=Armillaria solidipes TaxID=1076256 RepID=A0A2H3BM11_9AGAR|nr:hypothetical protein ARMSODRAFT_1016915 [Armillaria solidipes]